MLSNTYHRELLLGHKTRRHWYELPVPASIDRAWDIGSGRVSRSKSRERSDNGHIKPCLLCSVAVRPSGWLGCGWAWISLLVGPARRAVALASSKAPESKLSTHTPPRNNRTAIIPGSLRLSPPARGDPRPEIPPADPRCPRDPPLRLLPPAPVGSSDHHRPDNVAVRPHALLLHARGREGCHL